jgi:sarcosine oxidase subunit beta
VRRQGRHRAEAALASEAIARWPSLEEELDADMHYRQGGNLLIGESDADAANLAGHVQEQVAMGFTDVRLLDAKDTHEIVPALAAQVIAASYSPADGQADPPRSTRAFADAAQRLGATYWTETECTGLTVSGARLTGARTSREDVSAAQGVLAAGAWSDDLTGAVGLRLPIRMQALQMLRSSPAETGILTPVLGVMSRRLSLKQLPDGAFLLGGGWPGDVAKARRGYEMHHESMSGNWAEAVAVLPAVGEQQIARAWCGLEAMSIDNIPFIGPVPGLDGLTIATGFSGHGFAISPAVGRAVADQLAGQPTPELAGLSPARIAAIPAAQVNAFLREVIPLGI